VSEKAGTTFFLPTTVIEKIKKMTRKWNFKRMSRMIARIFLPHHEDDPIITVSLLRSESIRRLSEAIVLVAETEMQRIINKGRDTILDIELAVCPLRREYHLLYPHLTINEFVNPDSLTMLPLKIGLRAIATINPFCSYSQRITKQFEVDGKKWIVDSVIDIRTPNEIWYVSRRRIIDSKTMLMAWIHKCLTKANRAIVVSLTNGYVSEVEISEEHLRKIADELGLNLKDPDEFIRGLVLINVKKLKVPFWENECNQCPYRFMCSHKK